jgi:uncharacterized protein YdhG (YjbR/CyaY superfamily)
VKRAPSAGGRPAASGAKAVDAYIAKAPAAARAGLRKLRKAIRAAAPGADEGLGYGIPSFSLDGKGLVWYAAWTAHGSLYPVPAAVKRAHATELESLEITKGTLRFPHDNPPSAALVSTLLKARIAAVRNTSKGHP